MRQFNKTARWFVVLVVCVVAAPSAIGADKLSRKERVEGFKKLFNGKTLDGWVGSTKGYVAEKGLLVCLKKGGGTLFTDREYADFVFRFEFRLPPGGNNGLAIRAPLKGNPAYAGMELQILDNSAKKYANLKPYQYHGSVYGVVPAKRGHLKPVGEWNAQEVIVRGSTVKVILNGVTIVDVDLKGIKPLDNGNHPGLKRTKGHIGFMGHGDRIEFRNIRVRELK